VLASSDRCQNDRNSHDQRQSRPETPFLHYASSSVLKQIDLVIGPSSRIAATVTQPGIFVFLKEGESPCEGQFAHQP
jgi:hypothetical protein